MLYHPAVLDGLDEPGRLDRVPSWAVVGLCLSLLIPSLGILQKYVGLPGVAAYVVVGSVVITTGSRWVVAMLASSSTERRSTGLLVATFVVLFVVFAIAYSQADSEAAGVGSDRDDALDIATRALLDREYPYDAVTYLGNPISPMPGALLLAVPFGLLGSSAYQSIFWLFVLQFAVARRVHDGRAALVLLWAILALSPIIAQEFLTGGDYLANSIYVLVFIMWTVEATLRPGLGVVARTLPAVLLGIGMSSRANFVLLLPLVAAALVSHVGWTSARRPIAIAGVTLVAVTAPFYLADPDGFSPLHTSDKLDDFESTLPGAGVIVLAATCLVVVLLALSARKPTVEELLRNCAIVLAFPVLCGLVLESIQSGRLDVDFASYGLPVAVFGATACWPAMLGTNERLESVPHAASRADRA